MATIVAVTRIHGLAGRRDELRALMRETQEEVERSPGCRVYRFSAELHDPDEYVHVQEWDDEAVWRAHQGSEAFRSYQRQLFGLLARPSEMRVHTVSGSFTPEPSAAPDPRAAD
jgi:quinol monooxygenase YgiN